MRLNVTVNVGEVDTYVEVDSDIVERFLRDCTDSQRVDILAPYLASEDDDFVIQSVDDRMKYDFIRSNFSRFSLSELEERLK